MQDTSVVPIQAVATVSLPDAYGVTGVLTFQVDVMVAVRDLIDDRGRPPGWPAWRLSPVDLYETLEGLVLSLTQDSVVAAIADIADVDPVVVPQPPNLNFLTGIDVVELLWMEGLGQIPDAGTSRGANLLADPAIDLRSPDERRIQLDNWLVQVALDAGITGMEAVTERFHSEASS